MWYHWGSHWFLLVLPKGNRRGFPSGGRGGPWHKKPSWPGPLLWLGSSCQLFLSALVSPRGRGFSGPQEGRGFPDWALAVGSYLSVWDRECSLSFGLLVVESPYHCPLAPLMYLGRKSKSWAHSIKAASWIWPLFVSASLLMAPLSHPWHQFAMRGVLGLWRWLSRLGYLRLNPSCFYSYASVYIGRGRHLRPGGEGKYFPGH